MESAQLTAIQIDNLTTDLSEILQFTMKKQEKHMLATKTTSEEPISVKVLNH